MIETQNHPDAMMIQPCALTAGSNVTANLDTIGSDYATIRVLMNNLQATVASATGATVSLLSSDVTHSSSFATVVADKTGLKFGQTVRYEVDTKTAKRYLRVNITAGTAGVSNDAIVAAAIGTVSRRESSPTSIQALVALMTNNTNSTALSVTA